MVGDDPQQDEDEHVKRKLGAVWQRYARANADRARVCQLRGDEFGASLCTARAEIRSAAATLWAQSADARDAAREMHRRATALWQSDLPIVGFDAAAVRYTEARTWQDCARAIDPDLPEVQPLLTWDEPTAT